MDKVLRKEQVGSILNIQSRVAVGQKRGCELTSLVGVDTHQVLDQVGVVRLVANLLAVRQDLVELAQLSQTGNDLDVDVGTDVHGQSKVVSL